MLRLQMITGYFLSVRNFALAIALIVEVDPLGWAYGPFTDPLTARYFSPTPTYQRLFASSTRPPHIYLRSTYRHLHSTMADSSDEKVARDAKRQCYQQVTPTPTKRLPIVQRTRKLVEINSLVASFDRTTLAPAILRLPNELLDRIASFLVPSTDPKVMEGMGVCIAPKPHVLPAVISAKCPAAEGFQRELSNLRNVALVCRHFRLIVERILYEHICLPQPAMGSAFGLYQYPASTLPYFVRTMFDRPGLAARIDSLKVWIRDRRLVTNAAALGLHSDNPYYEVFKASCMHLGKLQMSFAELNAWSKELYDYQEFGLHAILISLLPNLKSLDLCWPYHHPKVWTWTSPGNTERPVSETPNYSCMELVLGKSSLTSIHIGSYFFPIQTFPVASLTTLTLDFLWFGGREAWDDSKLVPLLPNVHTLSVTCNAAFSRSYRLSSIFTELEMHPSLGLNHFLEHAVPGLQRLSLDPPKGTEPRSGTIYGKWGEELAPLRLDEDPQDLEQIHESLFGGMFGDELWAEMLHSLDPVKKRLKHLSLPSNWYSSTGQDIKPLPSLQVFPHLETLRLPNVAIISNPHAQDYDPNEHDTHAYSFLPKSLETFTVTQANTKTCTWLQEGFSNIELLPQLKEVQLFFREDYWAIFPEGFENDARKVGVRVVAHWKGGTRVA
jgi:hypothetical protein